MKSPVSKRSVVIAGHKTSVSLEDEFWNSLKQIARSRGMTVAELIAAIDGNRQRANLSSAFASLSLASIGIERPPPKLIQSPSDLRSHTRRRIGGVLSPAAECSTGFASITLTFPTRANMLREIAWSSRSAKSSRVMTAVADSFGCT
jgi:predicted DNA-binding ribbon-helix-helix protein